MESATAARQAPVAVNPAAASRPDADAQVQQETDGFHLLIDALKLNGIDTIFGLPGIPITDLTRKAQASGLRVVSFRHEQSAGYAASI
ncbi:MAG TPA: thiamine pyrophosphate-binding protein, partial [Casimicrobiaceae bacterium]|nr:thiamine pyrophosphate-binding protein [Casimicrobiaceae bacterium]